VIKLFRNLILFGKSKKKIKELPEYPRPGVAEFFKVTPRAEINFLKVKYISAYASEKFTIGASAVITLTKI
jgi:hypothetical protein